MTTGIFGGSFDPIHKGHIAIAEAALREGGLDEVWLMVSPENPFKAGLKKAPMADRIAMANLAIAELPEEDRNRIIVSDFEENLPKPSYTIDTLRALKKTFPDREFRLIVGGDNFAKFDQWRDPAEILRDFGLIVYPRPEDGNSEGRSQSDEAGSDDRNENGIVISEQRCLILEDVEMMDISSTKIREAILKGKDIKELVKLGLPASVAQYIKEKGLYGKTY